MNIHRVSAAWCVISAVLTVPQAFAAEHTTTGRFIAFDIPGAGIAGGQGTTPADISLFGVVTGHYVGADGMFHGFVRTPNGNITAFDVPGAGNFDTLPSGINAFGAIVGSYSDVQGNYHGFVRSPSGVFRIVDFPGVGIMDTFAYSINDLGAVVGYYTDTAYVAHAFEITAAGAFVAVQPNGASSLSLAYGVNDAGTVAGEFVGLDQVYHGSLMAAGAPNVTFDAPGAGQLPDQGTFIGEEHSLNMRGDVTGYYTDAAGVDHGFLRRANGGFASFDAPLGGAGGPVSTFAMSVNWQDVICGFASGADGVAHGFYRAPGGAMTMIDAPALSLPPTVTVAGTFPLVINALGAVSGFFEDSTGVEHGFVWSPRHDE